MVKSPISEGGTARSNSFADSISIESFRGLENVKLDGLKQVNLLVGGNNSGKTSILEAIAVLYAGTDVAQWLDVSLVREVRTFASSPDSMPLLDTISWMFPSKDVGLWDHDCAGKIILSADTQGGDRKLSASVKPFEGFLSEKELTGYMRHLRNQNPGEPVADHGVELEIDYSAPNDGLFNDEGTKVFQIWSQRGFRMLRRRPEKKPIVQYIPPYGHRNSTTNISALSRSLKDDNANMLNDLMTSLDGRISGVELVTSENGHRPQIAVRLQDRRLVPLSVMGDGTRRALSISLSILASEKGILLIDEIEAAFHVSAFSKVFDWLMMASGKYQVQIFATTHSLEAIEAIAKSSSDEHSLSAYAIGSEYGQVSRRYTGGMLQRLVVEAGLDIRL